VEFVLKNLEGVLTVRKKVSQFRVVQELVSVATAVKGPPDQFTGVVVPTSVPLLGAAEKTGAPAANRVESKIRIFLEW
jgi:hypothetical protein